MSNIPDEYVLIRILTKENIMHIAKLIKRDGLLMLKHVEIDGTAKIHNLYKMWDIGSEGYQVVDMNGTIVSHHMPCDYSICWGWLINKAIEIEEMNNDKRKS